MSRDGRFGRWHRRFRGGGWGLLDGRSGGGRFDAWSSTLGQSRFSNDNLETQWKAYATKIREAPSRSKRVKRTVSLSLFRDRSQTTRNGAITRTFFTAAPEGLVAADLGGVF